MTTLTVSQVNRYIKALIEEIPQTRNIYVVGEISNFKHYNSGHMYFTLKDSTAQLKCVMFSSDNYKLKFVPENGMQVVCFGQISVYERDGVYQLYVHGMQPKGIGALTVAYEQLKEKLESLGYFNEEHKKTIPRYPSKIGVATSNMGAAVEDIKNVITRRFPACEIIISPTVVQGDEAAPDIVRSIQLLDSINVDVIIVGRGGGSIEDLWAFNTEAVANAVYSCRTPIISAVGHETDFTICDFVADLRAPTPSAAAELAVPDIATEISNIYNLSVSLENAIHSYIDQREARLDSIVHNSPLANASVLLESQQKLMADYNEKLRFAITAKTEQCDATVRRLAQTLNALSPLAVIGRGYSIVTKQDDVVIDAGSIKPNDELTIKMKNGSIIATAKEVVLNE